MIPKNAKKKKFRKYFSSSLKNELIGFIKK